MPMSADDMKPDGAAPSLEQAMYQVDAFAEKLFEGNPAGVCPLDPYSDWPPAELMQNIATENNLAETAFIKRNVDCGVDDEEGRYAIRWFTPSCEIDLCGHATLGTGHVVFNHLGVGHKRLQFQGRGGQLNVEKDGELLALELPALESREVDPPDGLLEALGWVNGRIERPRVFRSVYDLVVMFPSRRDVQQLTPDTIALSKVKTRGVVCTAVGDNGFDFVSRFFAPAIGIPEDPVCGSAHGAIVPLWSVILGKTQMKARQESKRGATLYCDFCGDCVKLRGRACTFMKAFISAF